MSISDLPIPTDRLDQIAGSVSQLYNLPAVAVKVIQLTDRPKIDALALKACIENDPALTAKLMRVVNSSLFGLPGEVADLNQALALLGTKTLKLLVLGFSFPQFSDDKISQHVLTRYWLHSLTKAVASREVAQRLWKANGDEALIAGLLQDLGLLVLVKELGEPFIRFLERIDLETADIMVAQKQTLGFCHIELTARLLDRWQLPPSLVRVIGSYPTDESLDALTPDECSLAKILHLSELLAQLLADRRTGVLGRLMETGESYCNLTIEDLSFIVDELSGKVLQLRDVLSLNLQEDLNYTEILAEAQAQIDSLHDETDNAPSSSTWPEGRELTSVMGQLTEQPFDEHTFTTPAGNADSELSKNKVLYESQFPSSARQDDHPRSIPNRSGPWLRHADVVRQLGTVVQENIAQCRENRCAFSFVLFQVISCESPGGSVECPTNQHLAESITPAIDSLDGLTLYSSHDYVALLCMAYDRPNTIQLSRRLIRDYNRKFTPPEYDGQADIKINVGVATVHLPWINLPANEVIEAASRCLFASQTTGGCSVKSIDV